MLARLFYPFAYLRACFRIMLGFCPECNSDAPALYKCPVCNYYTGHYPYPPSSKTLNKWLDRWKKLHSPFLK